jgi:hypothetical protein
MERSSELPPEGVQGDNSPRRGTWEIANWVCDRHGLPGNSGSPSLDDSEIRGSSHDIEVRKSGL